jgi:RHS repeat-associated protein
VSPTGSNQLFDDLTLLPFNPQQVRLTTYDGRIIDFDRDDGIVRLEDRNGNELFITDDGITHSSGKSITFDRDALGRIERIVDPMGFVLQYGYDVNGDLVRFVDQEGNATTFTYDQRHNLRDIINPLGVNAVRSEYDANGRLIATLDAQGNRIELAHDVAARTETIRNRLGEVTVMEFDLRGNVIRETYPDGSSISRTFDANDNMLSRTDELNRTTTFTYDAFGKELTETDPLGHTTTTTWTTFGEIASLTDATGAVTQYFYNIDRNLERTIDPEGFVTERRYDSLRKDRVVFERNGRGHYRTFAYDASGNVVREVDERRVPTTFTFDANGVMRTRTTTRSVGATVESLVTTFTPDAMGRTIRTDHPDGSSTETVYDAAGRVAEQIDQLGRVTSHTYDDLGQRIATFHPDGTSDQTDYDLEGRAVTRTDRGGHARTFGYDVRGRLASVTFDGATTASEYDDAGQLIASVDPKGHRTEFEYDLAGRMTTIRDPLLHETHRTYDPANRLLSVTNPRNQTTTFEYDGRGLQTRIVYNDGTTERLEHDGAANLIRKWNQEDHLTQFTYDERNDLIAVTDPTNHTWTFGYDEQQNRIGQTDPNLHSTAFAFDAMGRETRRTLPDSLFQQRMYDLRGNLSTRINYSGAVTTYGYDASDRLEVRRHPDMPDASFSYTPTGRRATVVDARGITVYAYDGSDRLEQITYPDGASISYGYDLAGNLTEMEPTVGVTRWKETHGHSPRNEITSVSTDGLTFALTYSATGQLETLAYPNGLTTTYAYDDVDRLESIVLRNAQSQVVSSYAYTRYPDGNIETITEADGTLSAYVYDAADRLVQATVTSSTGALVYAEGYAYDPAGNRIVRFHTPASGVTAEFDYAYDSRDRIQTDGIDAYAFDADGRMTSRSGADGFTLGWNSEDRLTSIGYADGSVADHLYDVDGVLVQTESSTGGAAHYLIDQVQGRSQVVAEIDPHTRQVVHRYLRAGGAPLAILRPGGDRFIHSDHLGSIRQLSTSFGTISDRYMYGSFGVVLSQSGFDPNPYLFAGERFDSSRSISYNRARWYLPRSGFVSIDPVDGTPRFPRSLEKYSYGGSDPINTTDPLGKQFDLISLSISFAIVGLLVSLPEAFGGRDDYIIHRENISDLRILARTWAGLMIAGGWGTRVNEYFLPSDRSQVSQSWNQVYALLSPAFGKPSWHVSDPDRPQDPSDRLFCRPGSTGIAHFRPVHGDVVICEGYSTLPTLGVDSQVSLIVHEFFHFITGPSHGSSGPNDHVMRSEVVQYPRFHSVRDPYSFQFQLEDFMTGDTE